MNHEPLELMNHEPHELSESVQSQKNTKNAKDGARLPHSWEEKAGVRASKFGRAALLRGPNIRAARQHRPTVNQYISTSTAACSADFAEF